MLPHVRRVGALILFICNVLVLRAHVRERSVAEAGKSIPETCFCHSLNELPRGDRAFADSCTASNHHRVNRRVFSMRSAAIYVHGMAPSAQVSRRRHATASRRPGAASHELRLPRAPIAPDLAETDTSQPAVNPSLALSSSSPARYPIWHESTRTGSQQLLRARRALACMPAMRQHATATYKSTELPIRTSARWLARVCPC
jgi:hypothetical protein